jgi:sulfur carrier protein
VKVRINGQDAELEPGATVADVLRARGLFGAAVAVAVDGEVVPRSAHDARTLTEGAKVELVRAVGGG